MADKKSTKFKLTFGPLEQAITVLVIMGFAANPGTLPWNPFMATAYGGPGMSSITNIPLFTPPMIMLVLIAYIGYYLLSRQATERDQKNALANAAAAKSSKSSSSSSSSSKTLSSSDVRSKGMPSSSRSTGNPEPKQVSGKSSSDPRKDPSSSAFRNNFFMTMQGPGRPALVPFQSGLRPPKGSSPGTMWWNNVPEDATDLMAPPVDPKKSKEMLQNPWIMDIIGQDIELLKLKKQQKEEDERYAKVASLMQTILGFLLCLVDMRLGVLSFVFFLWRHFSLLHSQDLADEQDAIEKEKKALERAIKEASALATPEGQLRVKELTPKLKRL